MNVCLWINYYYIPLRVVESHIAVEVSSYFVAIFIKKLLVTLLIGLYTVPFRIISNYLTILKFLDPIAFPIISLNLIISTEHYSITILVISGDISPFILF